jgi:F-type H+-transporting ATPase subunit delta
VEEIARVYADALFRAAKEEGKLDEVREQLAQLAEALESNRELQLFFFSPYFSSTEKIDGLRRALEGADPLLINLLDVLNEKHRMPLIFRIRRQFESMWARENKRLEVTVTSAVDLDPAVVERIGEELESQTGQTIELQSRVDDGILGGLVLQVGNMVMDASVRNRLEKLRKDVAAAA